MKKCHKCGAELENKPKPGFRDTCIKCLAPIHCCLNCSLFEDNKPNKCVSSTTDWVPDREKGNFCEEFTLRDRPDIKQRKNPAAGWQDLWNK